MKQKMLKAHSFPTLATKRILDVAFALVGSPSALPPKKLTLNREFERTDGMKSEANKERKNYTEEYKRSIVDHWCNSGKTAKEVAQEFGTHIWNLRDWKSL